MTKNRLEAFSDGVLAIVITIMVLELKAPHHPDLRDLLPLWPIFLSYLLSFGYVAIYWNNHHHLLHSVKKVNGPTLWANMLLLFFLSLIPFVTAWMGENHFAPHTVALYGAILMLAGVAYYLLTRALIALHGKDSTLAHAVGNDRKEILSVVIYLIAIPLALKTPLGACVLYYSVAFIWLIPDKRIERAMTAEKVAE